MLLVAVAATAHFAFLAYVVAGGFLALKRPRTVAVHIGAVLWGFGGLAAGWPCPLTSIERWARAQAGMPGLPPEGFIAHYITGTLYPADAEGVVRILVGVTVAVSWGLVARQRLTRHRRLFPSPRLP